MCTFNGTLFTYEYGLKDNLGNIRVTIYANPTDGTQNAARVLQENSYYPFGMVMPNGEVNYTSGVKNNYLYNGKEFQEELGQLDYGARFYDPAIGRWSVADPLAEDYYNQSAYNYGLNNPIRYIDPSGMSPQDSFCFSCDNALDGVEITNSGLKTAIDIRGLGTLRTGETKLQYAGQWKS